MVNINRMQTEPVRTPRTVRRQPIAVMTTFPAGYCAPVAFIPLLREDELRAQVTINCEMMETHELLANKVVMRATAYLYPKLAEPRFEGSRDQLDRAYMGQPQVEGGEVVPYIVNHAFGSNQIYHTAGLPGKTTDQVNTDYLECYRDVWNFRAKNRSADITLLNATALPTTLAPAFWNDSRFAHVLPSFDQAVIDGEVALEVVNNRVAIRGLAVKTAAAVPAGTSIASNYTGVISAAGTGTQWDVVATRSYPETANGVYGELAANGVSLSLSSLAVARKAQWFANLRKRFEGYDDEWIIDMLMSGLSIPEQHLKQPILLADVTTTFGQVKRYATDADNLTVSAVSGGAVASFDINVPRLAVGGVVMIQIECMPQQLYERQQDPYLALKTANHLDQLPDYLRDELDPQKVDILYNKAVDTAHTSPDDVFGYWPMNAKWNSWGPRIGGNMYRPAVDSGTAGVRGRFWAQEDVNPKLTDSFYLVKDLQTKVFVDQAIHPFQAAISGLAALRGNTVFGGLLVAETNNYDEVMDKVPATQIDQEA